VSHTRVIRRSDDRAAGVTHAAAERSVQAHLPIEADAKTVTLMTERSACGQWSGAATFNLQDGWPGCPWRSARPEYPDPGSVFWTTVANGVLRS
jgi:hypothetical protein